METNKKLERDLDLNLLTKDFAYSYDLESLQLVPERWKDTDDCVRANGYSLTDKDIQNFEEKGLIEVKVLVRLTNLGQKLLKYHKRRRWSSNGKTKNR